MMNKESKYINVKGQLMDLSEPRVMGILNVTPDSFYSESRLQTVEKIAARVVEIVNEGADFIDIGAYSSRPNADHVSLEEEMNRLRMGLEVITDVCPSIPISVDTFRADAARMCVEEYGAALINDISAGEMDSEMFSTVAGLGVPYIIMHMKGTPQTMQQAPHYDNLMKEIFRYFARKIHQLYELGVKDLILDPKHFNEIREEAVQLLKHIHDMELSEIVAAVKNISVYKLEITDYLDIIMIWYRDVLLYKATKEIDKVVFKDQLQSIKEQARKSSYEGIELILESLEKAKARLKANVNFDLVMELLFLTIKEN